MRDTEKDALPSDAAPSENTKGLYIKTYGCQMNVYDSDRMKDVLKPIGYTPVDAPENADLVILNTCHIREKATEKVFSELGVLKKMKAENGGRMRIAVAGCVAQAEGEEIIRRQPVVDLVVGPQSYHRLPEMIARISRKTGDRLETDFAVEEKFDALPKTRSTDGPSAFLSVQEGCDKFCTFCVVPYTRGAEHSRDAEDVLEEARTLASSGVREIVLIGQNVNAWHGAGANGDTWGLGRLIEHVAKIDGVERIRFSTSHPKDMREDLVDAYASVPELAPYLHLPVQSGSDRILKAMNRAHTAESYLQNIRDVRAVRPDVAIASDFIVGFPGETDEDFQATLNLVREVEYAQAYAFKYSRRPGTPAADMSLQVDEAVKDARIAELLELLRSQTQTFNSRFVGRTVPVLFDRAGKLEGQARGYTPYQQVVYVDDGTDLMGKTANVEITGATRSGLSGKVIRATTCAPHSSEVPA